MTDLKRLARKLGVRKSDDPEGSIAVLQVARRLVQDHGYTAVHALNESADKYAAPIDPSRAFWAAHYALTTAGLRSGLKYSEISDAEIDVLLPIFDQAIQNQGKMNMEAKKD